MRNLALAPLEGNLRAGVIPHADLLTIEAQQSLLKSLEEPPKHAYIFLGASSTSVLLPTIVSRCHIIPIVDKRMDTKEEINKTVTFVTTLLAASPGEKIRMIESVGKNKEAYVLWIDRTIGHLHAASEFSLLRQLLNTKQYVGNNVNPLLLIEHVVLAASGTI